MDEFLELFQWIVKIGGEVFLVFLARNSDKDRDQLKELMNEY